MKELNYNDLKYVFRVEIDESINKENFTPDYKDVYKAIENSLLIKNNAYNLYIIDNYSKEKVENLKKYIEGILKYKDSPKDICYVIYDDVKKPKVITLENGTGRKFKEDTGRLLEEIYKKVSDFYNSSAIKEKDDIIDDIQKQRNTVISKLMNAAEEAGFELRPSLQGFSFTPLNEEGKGMSEKEFDNLDHERKDEILKTVQELKAKTQSLLNSIKEFEGSQLDRLKELYKGYLEISIDELLDLFRDDFSRDYNISNYINVITKTIKSELEDLYSMNFEDDEELINETVFKYKINVIVDNKETLKPKVLFEEDPSVSNLIGSMEYENHNGVYTTDIELIKSGDILSCSDGCLILRLNSLLENPGAFYYLKKTLMTGKVSFDFSKGYLELLSLDTLKPEPANVKLMVILIGDYYSYDILYNYDEDFKKLFKYKAEYDPLIEINETNSKLFSEIVIDKCKNLGISKVDDTALYEMAKYLSRKAEDRKRVLLDMDDIDKVLTLSCNEVLRRGGKILCGDDIISKVYSKDISEIKMLESYKEGKLLIDIKDSKIGQVNGLSVIDLGYLCFGRPIRITCSVYPGEGNIVDCNKENNLSGNVHKKSINILKGCINNLLKDYKNIPVDFSLSFEQVYGLIDGDSASLAEISAIISAISKIPIKQNIAITGSVNQFGEVQPIGGVNYKIEGFYDVCKSLGFSEAGAVIPVQNENDLVLKDEILEKIKEGKFHIYTVKTLEEVLSVLMDFDDLTMDKVLNEVKKEMKKYVQDKKK